MRGPPLKKALGQHHLREGALCRPVIDFLAGPRPPAGRPDQPLAGQRVVEVGPGGGVLTAELLAAGARVAGWELDPRWAFALRRDRPARGLSIILGDALDISWGHLPAPTLAAGNLPYGIATALVERLLPNHARVPRAAFLVQREVAERLVASPGAPAYGSLSVLVAAYARPRLLARVRRGSFHPPPKVEGAFVGFELHPPPLPAERMDGFIAIVRLAFAQRRKTLRNALAAGWGRERAAAVLAALGFPPACRAEQLGLADFLALYQDSGEP
ncbi:MAG TPA: 16S rRNA (adenine(1518)-N(6)/adenine(1519)-N(6))-dimethyltransferase RsmA [Thermoanaerobaculia bacterium]|nr:16S rRNA (adenine(1518)-N(6)/adenine(1519)-N(6))-dimethyltransferase RsmA [Thermoanaerobaculia bacterium]